MSVYILREQFGNYYNQIYFSDGIPHAEKIAVFISSFNEDSRAPSAITLLFTATFIGLFLYHVKYYFIM